MSIEIVVVIALVAVLAVVVAKRKKSKPSDPMPWTPPVLTEPTTIKPAPTVTPPKPDPVLLDRNRKSPGDPGYDPRAVRPDPEFSPIEPQGTFWGEGPFDPAARYIDLNGKFHNAG